jgi:translocation and assembly module TamA
MISPRLVELNSTYMIPLGNPNQTRLELNASVSREDYPHSLSTLGTIGPVHVSNRGNWTERKSLKLRQERFQMKNQDGHSTLLVPGWQLRKIRLDRAALPRRGYSLSGQLRGSLEALESETSFLQFSGEVRYVRQLLPVGLRLHLRSSLGATAVDDITDLPPTLRFFTGGDDSVRGYSYFDLGARRGGNVIGGKHLLVGSAELEQDIIGNWSAAIFFDAGNSFNQFSSVRDRYKRSHGVGIRWRSPIGPFQLDYAQALDEPDRPARIHFSIGPRI